MPGLMRMINILSRCHTMYRGDRLREQELNSGFYNYVLPIHFNPGMSQEQLARHVCLDKCNVTRHLSKLEEGGYAVTCTVQDRGRDLLSVTLRVSDPWQAEQIKEHFLSDPALLYRSNLAVLTGDAGMRRAGSELVIKL